MATREKNKEGSGERLSDYREQLNTLSRASEAAAGLRERVAGLEYRANELAVESAGLADTDEAFERESELVTMGGCGFPTSLAT
jgi:hypothetical protein